MTAKAELHVTGAGDPIPGCIVNLNSAEAWFFIDNLQPSVVASTFLSRLRVNGAVAGPDGNVRVVQYFLGAVVIPHAPSFAPMEVFDGANFTGPSKLLTPFTAYNDTTLGALKMAVSSFKATIAAMTDMLDTLPFVERYALYNWVEDVRRLVWDDGSLSAAGVTYIATTPRANLRRRPPHPRAEGEVRAGTAAPSGSATSTLATAPRSPCSTPKAASGNLRFTISINGNSAGSEQILETSPLVIGEWTHLAITLVGNTGTIHVNGAAAASGAITVDPAALNSVNNYLGKAQFAADPLFNGLIDDFRIYNRGLAAPEIAASPRRLRPRSCPIQPSPRGPPASLLPAACPRPGQMRKATA